jgi:LacI family transcriptional regulator
MSTIHELARRSGFSIATVSKALNDYADVSASTRARILELAAELDYTPSAAARTLVTQRSHVIGVVLETGPEHPDLQHPFFQEVLVGLKAQAGADGFDLLLFASELPGHGVGHHGLLKRCRHHRVDGLVLIGVAADDPEVAKIVAAGIPVVAIDRALTGPKAGYVGSENEAGAAIAVRHLHGLGHDRIATIAGPTDTTPGRARLDGFRRELRRLGLRSRTDYVQVGDFYAESGRHAMRDLLALKSPPTAVFAASDLMAVGALRAAQEAGVSVPGDVALVGFDDVQLAELVIPSLTTIRQDKVGIGAAAAGALTRMVAEPGAEPPSTSLPVVLVVRESCGAQSTSSAAGDGSAELTRASP